MPRSLPSNWNGAAGAAYHHGIIPGGGDKASAKGLTFWATIDEVSLSRSYVLDSSEPHYLRSRCDSTGFIKMTYSMARRCNPRVPHTTERPRWPLDLFLIYRMQETGRM